MTVVALKDLVGQPCASRLLRHSIQKNRMAHAYLFVGPDGTGKSTAAMSFARALVCPEDPEGCGHCPSCLRVAASSHPDVKMFTDKSSLGIDAMRSLQHDAWLKPQESARKVYVIDDAGSLTVEACNSLLKILEDPPGYCTFILVCADGKSLPSTVLSRCQAVPFRPSALVDIEAHLVSLGKTRTEAKALATASRGLLGQALILADSPHYAEFKDRCAKVAREAVEATPARALELAEELEPLREELEDILDAMAGIYRDAMVLRLMGASSLLHEDTGTALEDLAAGVSPEHLCEAVRAVQEARTWICRNANRRLALDIMMMRIAGGRRSNP